MLQETDIVRHLVSALSDTAENSQHFGINFSGICLTGDRNRFFKAHFLYDFPIQLFDFFMIPVKKIQETGLGTCRTLYPQHHEAVDELADVQIVEIKILHPQGGSLAYRGQLSRLKMSESQSRHVFVFQREYAEPAEQIRDFMF